MAQNNKQPKKKAEGQTQEQTEEQPTTTKRSKGKVIRTVGIVAVAGLLLLAIITSVTVKPDYATQVWDERSTLGSLEAQNYYVMYTDIACPYCDVFTRATIEHGDEFKQFIEDNDILFEVRMTDYIYESMPDIKYSRDSAEAVYCARNEGRFWDYYHAAVQTLWDDYQSHGYGSSKTAPPITGMPDDYWQQIGHKIGLGESFDRCLESDETLAELDENTHKTINTLMKAGAGMPYFQFNKWTSNGFDDNWGWSQARQYLEAGLSKK